MATRAELEAFLADLKYVCRKHNVVLESYEEMIPAFGRGFSVDDFIGDLRKEWISEHPETEDTCQ